MTLVETVVAFALLMMAMALFGSITLFALDLPFRETETSQAEILADTLITRIDETLRFAEIHDYDGTQLRFTSTAFPRAGAVYATLCCDDSGQLAIRYGDREYPLLPDAGYDGLEAEFVFLGCQNGILRLRLAVEGGKYDSRYTQEFHILLANG